MAAAVAAERREVRLKRRLRAPTAAGGGPAALPHLVLRVALEQPYGHVAADEAAPARQQDVLGREHAINHVLVGVAQVRLQRGRSVGVRHA